MPNFNCTVAVFRSAAIDENGNLWTWGKNGSWFSNAAGCKLGHNSLTASVRPRYLYLQFYVVVEWVILWLVICRLVESLKNYGAKIAQVSCSEDHTLVLTDDGEVLSCGIGDYGRLGTGGTDHALEFETLSSLVNENIIQIAAGKTHSLCLSEDGTIYSWGCNDKGQLGINVTTLDYYSMESTPKAIELSQALRGEKRVVQVAAGDCRSAFITADGKLFLWGTRRSTSPEPLDSALFDGMRVVRVAIGGLGGQSVVACITEDGGLWTLGEPSAMLGNPDKVSKVNLANSATPVAVPKFVGTKVLNVYAGLASHVAARAEFSPKE